jgi:chemotaxis signal transduction protein
MSAVPAAGIDRAAELRRSFDESFARAPFRATEPFEDLLALRIAGDAFAVRRSDVGALLAGRKLSRLPGPWSAFLGVVGFRGQIVPVYSLRGVLGYPPGDSPRWAILAAAGDPVALAFDQYEGYLRLAVSQLAPPDGSDIMPHHVCALARHQGIARAVLNVPSVLDTIRSRVRPVDPSKER